MILTAGAVPSVQAAVSLTPPGAASRTGARATNGQRLMRDSAQEKHQLFAISH